MWPFNFFLRFQGGRESGQGSCYRDARVSEYLAASVAHYRFQRSNDNHIQFPDIAINYADLLSQDQLSGKISNLEEVIRLLEEARVVMKRRSSRTEK